MAPGADSAGGGGRGEDEGGAVARQLAESGLVAVVGFGLGDDDEVWRGELRERGDAGGLLVGGQGDFGVEDLGGPCDPGVEEDVEGGWWWGGG